MCHFASPSTTPNPRIRPSPCFYNIYLLPSAPKTIPNGLGPPGKSLSFFLVEIYSFLFPSSSAFSFFLCLISHFSLIVVLPHVPCLFEAFLSEDFFFLIVPLSPFFFPLAWYDNTGFSCDEFPLSLLSFRGPLFITLSTSFPHFPSYINARAVGAVLSYPYFIPCFRWPVRTLRIVFFPPF